MNIQSTSGKNSPCIIGDNNVVEEGSPCIIGNNNVVNCCTSQEEHWIDKLTDRIVNFIEKRKNRT